MNKVLVITLLTFSIANAAPVKFIDLAGKWKALERKMLMNGEPDTVEKFDLSCTQRDKKTEHVDCWDDESQKQVFEVFVTDLPADLKSLNPAAIAAHKDALWAPSMRFTTETRETLFLIPPLVKFINHKKSSAKIIDDKIVITTTATELGQPGSTMERTITLSFDSEKRLVLRREGKNTNILFPKGISFVEDALFERAP